MNVLEWFMVVGRSTCVAMDFKIKADKDSTSWTNHHCYYSVNKYETTFKYNACPHCVRKGFQHVRV